MATKMSKATENKLAACLQTAKLMRDSEIGSGMDAAYWQGYVVAAEQYLRILNGVE